MLAAIMVKQNQPLVIDEVELPQKMNFGQVLVKLAYSGICGSQIGEIEGVKGADPYLPHLLGHEGAGEVIAVGKGVKRFKVFDRVVLHWMRGVGLEADLPVYKWKGKPLNAGQVTTFNQYALVSENRLTGIPKWLNTKSATLMGCALTTAFGTLTNKAKILPGESIVVFGAGGVGLNLIQAAVLLSADPIIAVDIYDQKLALAKKMGATQTINSKKISVRGEIIKLLGKTGADVSTDTTGLPGIIELAYEITQPLGRTILVGVPKIGSKISIYTLPLHFGKVITGTKGGESNPTADIPHYLKLVKRGRLKLDVIITDEFELEDINNAITKMKSGNIAGRCVVRL